jgi:RNA recognition motif-containing protein
MAVRLFVGNLPYSVTEPELREYLSTAGQVSYLHLPKDRESGRPRGFAFVEFDTQTEADEAIRRLDGQLFKGRPLAINEARPMQDRAQSQPSRHASSARPDPVATPAAQGEPSDRPSRRFGADAPPKRLRGRNKGRSNSERAPKGPLREVFRGQIIADVDDDDSDDIEFSGPNFASRESDDDL